MSDKKTEQYSYQLFDRVGRVGEPAIYSNATEFAEAENLKVLHWFHGFGVVQMPNGIVFGVTATRV